MTTANLSRADRPSIHIGDGLKHPMRNNRSAVFQDWRCSAVEVDENPFARRAELDQDEAPIHVDRAA
ncbi:MAG: hypothetical protein AAFR28_09440 [Pseudomonadota bacterium]